MRTNSFFRTHDAADFAAFLEGLRRFIDQHNPAPEGGGTNPAPQWRDQLLDFAPDASAQIGQTLDFMGDLQADGLFDTLLHGVGTVSGKTQPYSVVIEDLKAYDPFCDAVSIFRFKKGNPWFGFRREDIATDTPRPWSFSRTVKKGQTELSFNGAMVPANLSLFTWRWFARVTGTTSSTFGDSPELTPTALSDLSKHFETALIWPDQGALFVNENSAVELTYSSLGWMSNILIPDASQPHEITDEICTLLDLSPKTLASVIAQDLAKAQQ